MGVSYPKKFAAAILATAGMLAGSTLIGGWLMGVHRADEPVLTVAESTGKGGTAAVAPAAPRMAEKPAAGGEPRTADLPTLLAASSTETGEAVFRRNCLICHAVSAPAGHKMGPNLWNVVGGDKAQAEGYRYSTAMAAVQGKWTYEELDAFLTAPASFVKGTKMAFRGLKDTQERVAVIAYLRSLSDSPEALP